MEMLGRCERRPMEPALPLESRLEVKGSPTRCPFCHDGFSGQEQAVVCGQCLSRHHPACWAGSCASCRSTARMVRDPLLKTRELAVGLWSLAASSLRRASAPTRLLLWLVTLTVVAGALGAAVALPEGALVHGVATLRESWLGESWAAQPGYWSHGARCPWSGRAGAMALALAPALLALSSAAGLARPSGARRRLLLPGLGLIVGALLYPAWYAISGASAPFDPLAIGHGRELLAWSLALGSLPGLATIGAGLRSWRPGGGPVAARAGKPAGVESSSG